MPLNKKRSESRLEGLKRIMRRRKLDVAVLFGQKNILSLVGVDCDNGALVIDGDRVRYTTDFRYVPAVRRTAPSLPVTDCHRDLDGTVLRFLRDMRPLRRIGFEGDVPASRYLNLAKRLPRTKFVDIGSEMLDLRAVKTPEEIARLTATVALNDRIWSLARRDFRPGMTEKDIQRVIRAYMNALGDGESFETIVCAGANAAECHHVSDDTVWRKGEPLLVDMGVKLDGICSDMTRCIPARGQKKRGATAALGEYAKIYALVLKANEAAIAAAKPGLTGRQLDAVARRIIRKAGYGKAFGHALGHGVGYEIHESPVASPRSETVLKPGMAFTIEPGIYLPGKLGVRIEDLVVITETGCEVLSRSAK